MTPSARSFLKTRYEAIASSTRGQVSQRTAVAPGLTLKTGASYMCRGRPVGESVSCTVWMSGFGRTRRSRSYPTHDDRGPVSPSGRANTRPGPAKFAAAVRSASSVDSAGMLPTSSRSLVTRGAIGVSSRSGCGYKQDHDHN
jgi:hypothetical protein